MPPNVCTRIVYIASDGRNDAKLSAKSIGSIGVIHIWRNTKRGRKFVSQSRQKCVRTRRGKTNKKSIRAIDFEAGALRSDVTGLAIYTIFRAAIVNTDDYRTANWNFSGNICGIAREVKGKKIYCEFYEREIDD